MSVRPGTKPTNSSNGTEPTNSPYQSFIVSFCFKILGLSTCTPPSTVPHPVSGTVHSSNSLSAIDIDRCTDLTFNSASFLLKASFE
ncbi:hypothetical protein ACET3Z_006547 [Daucus carota]